MLALDGLQPDVGHEVLWVLRDCLSSEILLAKSRLLATAKDLGTLLREAYRWVKQVSRLLANKAKRPAAAIRWRLSQILSRMRLAAVQVKSPSLGQQRGHFVKVSKSYWPGLFACYGSKELPRTNNDLEHLFGSPRYHERRASGRKRAAPGLVVCGSVRVIASVTTRLKLEEGLNLSPDYVARWQQTRAQVEKRRQARRQQRRFRRNPGNYLKRLEELAIQLSLLA